MSEVDPMRCGAHNRSGRQCGRRRMYGQRVCDVHGGKSPQALHKAAQRLRALVDPAIVALEHIVEKGEPDATRLAAARYLLELAGHRASVEVNSQHDITIRLIDETVLEQVRAQLDG